MAGGVGRPGVAVVYSGGRRRRPGPAWPWRLAAQLPDQIRTTEPYTGLSIRPQASYSSDRNIAAQKVKNMEIIAT